MSARKSVRDGAEPVSRRGGKKKMVDGGVVRTLYLSAAHDEYLHDLKRRHGLRSLSASLRMALDRSIAA